MAKGSETSIWKKEITFRRKPKAEHAVPEAATPAETSIWKKEITLRRKPKQASPYVPPPEEPRRAEWSAPQVPVEDPLLDPVFPPVTPPVTPPLMPPAAPSVVWSPPPLDQTVPESDLLEPGYPQTPVDPPVPAEHAPPLSEHAPLQPLPAPEPAPHEPSPELAPFEQPVEFPPYEPAPEVAPVQPAAELQPAAEDARFELPPEFPPYEPAPEVAAVAPTAELQPMAEQSRFELPPEEAAVQPAPEPSPVEPRTPLPSPVEQSSPSQQERREEQPAGDRLAKERRKQAKDFARRQRKSGPATQNRVVGLKVGASQIAAAYLLNKGGPRIVKMARMPLKRGIVVGGELREPEELAAALKAFFRKNKLPQTCVRLGISNNRIGVRTFEIAGIDDEKQLANAIRFRAQEALPIPLDEAVLDYRILDERLDDEGAKVRRVLLVVAHRELVERYVAACRKAGLKLIGIDLEAFALLRALADPAHPPAEDAAVVCVSIGHDRSTLAVSDGNVCEFTRVLAWGGSMLDVALARVLDLTPSAVEPIKHELVLGEDGEAAGLDAHHAGEARAAMAAELQTFARELVASLRFYQEQPNSLGIAEILLTGGAASTHGLAVELERLIGIPVRVADPFARVKAPRAVHENHGHSAGSLAVAVGLGIED